MFELNNFDSIQIGLASPEKIREWSKGEVKKPETINYRTLKPEKDGLFCERIFGPIKDWECHCGKYKRVRYKGIVCDRCGVEVTKSKVRRERMGHIELAAPVSHIWYFKGIPSRMGLILDMSPRSLEKVLYFAAYVVVDPLDTGLIKKQLLTDKEYREAVDKYGYNSFKAGMGAEAIKELLQEIDLEKLAKELRSELESSTGQKKVRTIRRLEVVEAFRKSGNRPEWMILDVIPVIPPDLRPMVQLDGGRFATSDLNDLYRRVINRNNRLKRLLDLGAPDIIVRNEKRMLQEAVDALIDNGRRGRPVTGPGNRPLKSLSDMLKGKQGRFRQNLLGKRVDYSGRSVIVVGPELKMYQCGLPKEMALELFKPFVMKRLVEKGIAHNIKNAKRMVERVNNQVWDILEEAIQDHPVLLNRAPTLHRLGIQAFQPVLVEGRAIKLHPLVCTAYNADFDGDQMAVHVPLTVEAQSEARFLMLAAHNILKPSDGKPVTVPTQDMVLGSYYLTSVKEGEPGEGKYFSSPEEAILAYQLKELGLHATINVKITKEIDGEKKSKIIKTTAGKLLFNEAIPQDLGFVDRSNPENMFEPEVDFLVDKKQLSKIVERVYKKHGPTQTAITLDNIKALGYHYSTIGALTVSVSDMEIPEAKEKLLQEADTAVDNIQKMFRRGFISEEERYERVIDTWTKTTEKVTDALMDNLDKFNPIFMMAHSGARGSKNQIRQLCGMRGLMANPSGRIIELPIRASFREGLNVLEYFISTHGARKGLADTALRTADSGYLTRRLVDVSQDTIVREEDCGSTEGSYVEEIREGNEVIESLKDRLVGRYTAEDVCHPETKEVLIKANEFIDESKYRLIENAGINRVKIRTVFTCKTRYGVCSKCYGTDMATGKKVSIGEPVGIIAAQSIGEPGTQLTMRTFHTGGVAGADITQGLPRVEELFEARKPKGLAIISEVAGTVKVTEDRKRKLVTVITDNGEEKVYQIPYGSRVKVYDGQKIEAGEIITEGSVNPHDILRIKGVDGVRAYLLAEVQKVYRLQGVDINDKHLEIIVKQMLRKVKVEDQGDTDLLPGSLVDIFEFNEENKKAEEAGLRKAVGKVALLGITKAALATDSFLSAASFQETTRVLTDAAIKGKIDPLVGLKEIVIIGKLVPAGSGMTRYNSIKLLNDEQEQKEELIQE
ncbi:DNA-directed RNA polymerase subunit beta' [Caloramator quimbayensis]|uniref:DNA-directed RNA polymerase subunit beta' n=1 Tax=Caloramator quimbayensis TaxID=1147123 RepID=A0A1T4YE76_9CLOT|nr:DNA-directed RNA polymerase subunit beta' [Caloramator quimbayensis]SKA99990.1 DNA-directed RNA polymerase subunit beta' [Caloramator quimbayensis]